MGRLLVIVALVAVIVWWLTSRVRPRDRNAASGTRHAPGAAHEMVACAHCGVHLPRADAVLDGDTPYCGAEHRRLGPHRP